MTRTNLFKNNLMRVAYLCFGLLLSTAVPAALVDLATAPLANSTTSLVLPNLMYVLDDSGSMASNYMPDYIDDTTDSGPPATVGKCKSTATSGAFTKKCEVGEPAYMLNAFNTIYYNPNITYLPGANADGTPKDSMTSAYTAGWTTVPSDAYGIQNKNQLGQNGTSISLIPNAANTAGYPDRVWCNTNSATTADLTDPIVCRQNSKYIYPNNTGTPATSYNEDYILGVYPYYYKNTPIHYCTNKDLTTCVSVIPPAVPPATHPYPATLLWCNSSALSTCQAKYVDGTYIYAKWLGISSATIDGAIRFNADATNSPAASPVALSVTNVKANGVTITNAAYSITDTTSLAQRSTLASNIAANINAFVSSPDYTATATGDVVTITSLAANFTGTIVVTKTSHTTAAVTPIANASGSITFTRVGKTSGGATTVTLNSLTVGSTDLLSGTGTCGSVTSASANDSSNNRNDFATRVTNMINSCASSPVDYTATRSNNVVTVTASGVAANGTLSANPGSSGNLQYTKVNPSGGSGTPSKTYTLPVTITNFAGGTPVVTTFSRVDIEPTTNSYPKALTRSDCAGATCTYDEEMTNFANWYSYYRTRLQLMKTSTTRAFVDIDTRYRVGFMTIHKISYLPVAKFDTVQKASWYSRLLNINTTGSTPLRSALATVGRIYAGKGSNAISNSADPMQYSCQQNFTLLTTDGYWNEDSASDVKDIAGTGTVGNADIGSGSPRQPTATSPRPLFEGPTTSSETLADAAKYYYDTDLRNASLGNCTGSEGVDVCQNNVFVSSTDNNAKQHMTTYTLGLGVDGTLTYDSDYKTQTSGDFYDLKTGTKNWPVPAQNTQKAVDDLWHAAVNGRGTYFSAKDPGQLAGSLGDALSSIASKVGAGAAAATSTLNPVAGDNFAYVASYATVKWTGNLEARTIDINTGEVSSDATWCAEDVQATTCASPSSIVTDTSGSSTKYFCSTPGATLATCTSPGVLNGTNCKVEIASACIGTMSSRVATVSDTRTILMKSGSLLVPFNYTNLVAEGKAANFESAFLSTNLTQWNDLTSAQQAAVSGANIVNFLRGQTGFEERASNVVGPLDNKLFRFREAVIGDPLESTPAFNGVPKATYTDPGYGAATVPGTFAYTQAGRDGTIYIGTNDGMLHAFNANNGVERWAYVPTEVIPDMWRLADKNYANLHTNYVNGDAVINDVCTANCTASTATWKTILVGGLNGGGKGYYALDVTNPDAPSLLWEFNTTSDSDLGYTFGNPVITKKADGTWVVVITSGYNNIDGVAANKGKGFLYVLNANTGAVITKFTTGEGSATTPSGLAKISAYITDAQRNNTAVYIYGGDLLGNLWRFNINAAQSSSNPFKLAKLEGPSAVAQPITVKPELSDVEGKRIVFVGTGKYLESTDLANTALQTLYGITDDNETTTLSNPRGSSSMVQQTISNSGSTRGITNNAVDYAIKRGWYIDLPDSGERQNVPSQLVFGTLLVPTIVPSDTVCSPGGYGWLNFINYKTGAVISQNVVGAKTNAPIVGINVLYVNGQPKVSVVTADNPTPEFPAVQPEFVGGSLSGFQEHRVIWRELLEQQQ